MFWKKRAQSSPELARIGLNFFVMEPTSVPSERTNSQAKNVVTDKRCRLDAESIKRAVCLKSWYDTFPHDTDFFFDEDVENQLKADVEEDSV